MFLCFSLAEYNQKVAASARETPRQYGARIVQKLAIQDGAGLQLAHGFASSIREKDLIREKTTASLYLRATKSVVTERSLIRRKEDITHKPNALSPFSCISKFEFDCAALN